MLGIRDDSHCSHGLDGGVSRLGLLQGMLSDMVSEKHPLVFSASAMQLLLIEDGPLPTHGLVSITHSRKRAIPNVPTDISSCTGVYVVMSFGNKQLPTFESS